MEKPIELNDDEVAAVGAGLTSIIINIFNGGFRGHFTNSFNNNLGSFAFNSNNNAFNQSFNTILSNNTITL